MKKALYHGISLCLAFILIAGMAPNHAFAADNPDEDKPIRLQAYDTISPIAKVEYLTPLFVNGRLAHGGESLWGGELLQAPRDRNVSVSFDAIGRVTLHPGAIAKISVNWKRFDDNINGSTLIASLVQGNVTVNLQDSAEAYIEANGSSLISSRGANFTVGKGETSPLLSTTKGSVTIGRQIAKTLRIRPVGGSANLNVRVRKTREVQFVVTDEHDKPVPDVPVVLAISGSGASLGTGAASVSLTTSATGLVTAPVTAGASVGANAATITATIPATGATSSVSVSAVPGAIIGGTTAAVAAAVAAAATTTAVVVVKNNKSEIKAASDPVITVR